MCRVLAVHFSGFYAWVKEPLSQRALEDARQTDLIKQAWADSGKVYGYRKLHPSRALLRNTLPGSG
jgi:putative transposase